MTAEPVSSAIPTIDLSAYQQGSARQQQEIAVLVDEVCRSIGFLVIVNHGVPKDTIDQAWSMASRFFGLPLDKKREASSPDPKSPRGYFPPQSESLAQSRGVDTPPDRKESFNSGPLHAPTHLAASIDNDFFYGTNIWPTEPAGFRDAWITYYKAMEHLGAQLMRLFATALRLPPDYFARFHTHHLSALRGLNYPPISDQLLPGQQRAGAHSDYGSVTILRPDDTVPGLEVQLPGGQWAAAPLVPDSFIVNIGDMMARWTNDRWVSTLHRVVSPTATDRGKSRRRQSIAYFQSPNYDAEVSCIPTCLEDGAAPVYPPVLAGQHLMDRFRSTV